MEKRDTIQAGYVALNGHVFTQRDADQYNRVQKNINAYLDAGRAAPEWMLDESHKVFCLVTEQAGF